MRSNGVVTYVGKDIANQFWKFGLLGRDFRYRRFATQAERPAALGDDRRATATRARRRSATRSGSTTSSTRGRCTCRRCSARRCARSATRRKPRTRFTSPTRWSRCRTRRRASSATRRPEGEDAKKPFVEVSGRKGLGVKIDDLLDLLIAQGIARKSRSAIRSSRPTSASGSASQIAVAAIRYFMLKFSRGKLIVFDIEEALSFEGETGPYLQYAVVRANNIFHKLQEREGLTEADILAALERDRRRRARRRRRRATRTPVGAVSSRRRGSTMSSSRSSGRSSSRCWPSTRSGWRSCSTRSTIGIRSSTKRSATGSAGGPRRRLLPLAADPSARPDGDRSSDADVDRWRSPLADQRIACRTKLEDYKQAILTSAARCASSMPSMSVDGRA